MTYALPIGRTAPAPVPIAEQEDRTALAGHRAFQAEAAARDVTDGPFIETKEWLVGFCLVDCENEERALARARLISPGDEVAIEVRPVTWRRRA